MNYIKKLIIPLGILLTFSSTAKADLEWAKTSVDFCIEQNIISGDEKGDLMLEENITREQMVKMLVEAFSLKSNNIKTFSDTDKNSWSYPYICAFSDYFIKESTKLKPKEFVTREEFLSYLLIAANYEPYDESSRFFLISFDDRDEIDELYKPYIITALKNEFIQGSGTNLEPKGLVTRAQACAFFYRVMNQNQSLYQVSSILSSPVPNTYIKPDNIKNNINIYTSSPVFTDTNSSVSDSQSEKTPIMGTSTVTLEQAKKWAVSKDANQRFIDIADYYWYYGEITGIRPEVLYAQSAKETHFGKFTGKVVPEQNNWAGIKAKGATGDSTYDHESFATPDDGVRAHFNHMGAYVGIEPAGIPHDRYYDVKSLPWAGTVKYVEDLGGKWAPASDYGESIVHDYIIPMINTK